MTLLRKIVLIVLAILLFSVLLNFYYANSINSDRVKVMENMLSILLVSVFVGLFFIFRQIHSFIVPLRHLSKHLNRISEEGMANFNPGTSVHSELNNLIRDVNTLIRNVVTFMENVRFSADRVSDLSGACSDMFDIMDFDSKMVERRIAEMTVASKDIIDNLNNIIASAGESESSKAIITKISDFSYKFKKMEEAHKAIDNTLIDAKNSMKVLNDLSANLRKIVDDVARLNINIKPDFQTIEQQEKICVHT